MYGGTPPLEPVTQPVRPRSTTLAAAVLLATIIGAVMVVSNQSVQSLAALSGVSTKDTTTTQVVDTEKKRDGGGNSFPVPDNKHLLIDLDPSKDRELFKGADYRGVGCNKFSLNDGFEFLGDTKTKTLSHNKVEVKDAYPGGVHKNMMSFEANYCDISRGSHGEANRKDGSACYRSEWTIDPKCRAKYLPVQGELWFGFSIYIPKHVANGLKSDKKFLHKQSDDVAKRMNSEVHELLDTEGGKVEGERSGDWDFLTSERNWLDLFQIHHGGDGQPARHVKGREPIIALTLMDGEYYTMMISGSDSKGNSVNTIERIADARPGKWEYFVYHTVMSSDKKKGLAELWRNGEKVFKKEHAATQYHTDTNYPFPKFGAYADTWKYNMADYANKKLDIGFGAFRMGGEDADYDDVCIAHCDKEN